jgi:hypothetical protein
MSSPLRLSAAIACLAWVISGCAHEPAAVKMGFEHPVWSSDGLYLVEHIGPGALFLAPPPLELDRYDGVIFEGLQLGYREGVPELNPRQTARLVEWVERNALRALRSQGLQRAEEAAPGKLRMRIAIKQIDYEPFRLYGASSIALRASGGAQITLELRDSVDNRRLFIYAQHRQLPWASYGGPGRIGADRVADAFYEYSEDLARHVGRAERGQYPGPRKHAATR